MIYYQAQPLRKKTQKIVYVVENEAGESDISSDSAFEYNSQASGFKLENSQSKTRKTVATERKVAYKSL